MRQGRRAAPHVPPPSSYRVDLALALAAFVASGAVYAATTARDIVFGDSPEFVMVAAVLGVAHPPGYPLQTLLGHLFTLLPFGTVPLRVNLLSAAAHAGTAVVVYLIAQRLTGSRPAALLAALLLAFGRLFWSWSLVAEVFPLNDFLAALLLLLLVSWRERPEAAWRLIAAGFVGGLALANHLTIVLLVPAALYLLWERRTALFSRPRVIAAASAALLVGLLPYAYLPWAAAHHPAWNWGAIASPSDLADHLLRRGYGTGQLVGSGAAIAGGDVGARLLQLVTSFGPLVGALLVLGAVQAFRTKRHYLWFSVIAFAFTGPLFTAYANANVGVPIAQVVLERFFLLAHVVVAPLVAFGALLLAEVATAWLGAEAARAAPALIGLGALVSTIGGIALNYQTVDQSANRAARTFAEDVLRTAERGSVLLAAGDAAIFPVSYLQIVEGERGDVSVVILPLLRAEWYLRQLREDRADLVLPLAQSASTFTLRSLVQTNPDRPVALLGDPSDDSLTADYLLYPRGLASRVVPKRETVAAASVHEVNRQLFGSYRPPSTEAMRSNGWLRVVGEKYAVGSFRVGRFFEGERSYADARFWYARALELFADFPEARAALSRLPR